MFSIRPSQNRDGIAEINIMSLDFILGEAIFQISFDHSVDQQLSNLTQLNGYTKALIVKPQDKEGLKDADID